MIERRLPETWLDEMAPAGLPDGPALAGYGAAVARGPAGLVRDGGRHRGDRRDLLRPPRARHELLERTVWHAAQHLRQIHALLEDAGRHSSRAAAIPRSWTGFPCPQSIW